MNKKAIFIPLLLFAIQHNNIYTADNNRFQQAKAELERYFEQVSKNDLSNNLQFQEEPYVANEEDVNTLLSMTVEMIGKKLTRDEINNISNKVIDEWINQTELNYYYPNKALEIIRTYYPDVELEIGMGRNIKG